MTAQLTTKRGQVKARLTRFESFLTRIEADPALQSQVEARLEAVKGVWADFERIQSQIEAAETGADVQEAHTRERDSFEDRYFVAITRAKSFILPTQNDNQTQVHAETGNTTPSVKLPQLNLPSFGGLYEHWASFRDSFEALINKNTSLSKVQKFYYLQSSLKDDAAQVIQSLQLTENNYDTAWRLLTERYENKRAIIQAHIKGIFDLPMVNKESHSVLRKFLDTFQRHFRSLQNLGEKVEQWDTILLFLLTSKLDVPSKREWEIYIKEIASPKIDDFTRFLNQRCQFLEALDVKVQINSSQTQNTYTRKPTQASHNRTFSHVTTNHVSCPLCKEQHFIYTCKRFLDMSTNNRISEVKRLNLCLNCLRFGHSAAICRSSSCKRCQKKHNSLLHMNHQTNTHVDTNEGINTPQTQATNIRSDSHDSSTNNTQVSQQSSNTHSHCSTQHACHSQTLPRATVILSTALVYVYNADNQPIKCKCLLDNGSQSSFVSEQLMAKLRLKSSNINIPVAGINHSVTKITRSVRATISSINRNFTTSLQFLVISNITDMTPQQSINISQLDIPQSIDLADPEFYKPSQIDMLLGANIFYELLNSGQMKLGSGKPFIYNTKLGWIVSGEIVQSLQHCFVTSVSNDLQYQVQKFWEIEELPQRQFSTEQQECEDHFLATFTRESTGRFCVQLPLKDNHTQLGNSLDNALRRFYALERQLSNNPQLKAEYTNFLDEYQNLGHMTELSEDEIPSQPQYYLPHHSVIKHSSSTTRLRCVFDASAKTSTGLSLNDVLKVGPTVQDDLFSIIIRFRKHEVALIGDISKMYRQINVHESQRDFQRVVWRSNPNESVKHYRLNTVTYGTASASFLAIRCLLQVGIEAQNSFPIESNIIMHDFYVDDLISGSHDTNSLTQIKSNLERILGNAGFTLRKFMSSHSDVLSTTIPPHEDIPQYTIPVDQSCKTLGISWNPTADQFTFSSLHSPTQQLSKRTILAAVSQIFDPIGLLQPMIIIAKLLLQKLWQLRVGWDSPIPDSLQLSWNSFCSQLDHICEIHIPRHVTVNKPIHIQIHGFCDSSEQAYGACIYVVSRNTEGQIKSALLCSKSRVAPLKVISIPRLELCGAVLLSNLLDKVLKALQLDANAIFCWTDSTIVLAWLSSEPSHWKTFIANRVSEIQQLTASSSWLHVPSNQNPADILSRGMPLTELQQSQLWWQGPSFLISDQKDWPAQPYVNSENVDTERRNISSTFTTAINTNIIVQFSTLNKAIRVLSYCFRFLTNSKSLYHNRVVGDLTLCELNTTKMKLIRLVQLESFADELSRLQRSKAVKPSSSLASLDPFLDQDGLIRVGGRIQNADISYSHKHPIILPKKHHFTRLIILSEHQRNLHSGIQNTLSAIRQQYWPINGRNEVRKVIRNCIVCFRVQPRTFTPKMGNLPTLRVVPNRVFYSCGIDYAGPFPLKDGNTRSRKIIKGYICVFICLASKAVHLELVTDLTAECFLDALKRFVSRRGLCQNVFSDNATNFVKANKYLSQSFNSLIQDPSIKHFISESQINWKFIPPRSAHFGGLWEACVKSVKFHLKRITQNTSLNYEKFSTFLCQIEAVLNSRPITPLSNDPNDLEALTPGHFIIGTSLNALPHREQSTTPTLVSWYKHMQRMTAHFWSKWSADYLNHLQQRTKWRFQREPESLLGSLAIIKEDNLPPMCWPLARIVKLYPGSDGIVRVVELKTKHGLLKRALTRVCVLPVECSSNSSDSM